MGIDDRKPRIEHYRQYWPANGYWQTVSRMAFDSTPGKQEPPAGNHETGGKDQHMHLPLGMEPYPLTRAPGIMPTMTIMADTQQGGLSCRFLDAFACTLHISTETSDSTAATGRCGYKKGGEEKKRGLFRWSLHEFDGRDSQLPRLGNTRGRDNGVKPHHSAPGWSPREATHPHRRCCRSPHSGQWRLRCPSRQ